MMTVTRTAQVLRYFAQQYGSAGIPRKRLIKAAYMADILSRQYLGHSITEFVYIKDHYGPNARELPSYTKELVEAELALEERKRDELVSWIRLKSTPTPILYDFSLGELEILAYVADCYLSMDIDEFIADVVKVTDPFVAVSLEGETLPMDIVDNTGRLAVGFDLEDVAKAERQAEEGNYTTLSRFADALRAQITSGRSN